VQVSLLIGITPRNSLCGQNLVLSFKTGGTYSNQCLQRIHLVAGKRRAAGGEMELVRFVVWTKHRHHSGLVRSKRTARTATYRRLKCVAFQVFGETV